MWWQCLLFLFVKTRTTAKNTSRERTEALQKFCFASRSIGVTLVEVVRVHAQVEVLGVGVEVEVDDGVLLWWIWSD